MIIGQSTDTTFWIRYKRRVALSLSHSKSDKTNHFISKSTQIKMKNLAITLFSTLLAFSNASFWEAGPCPPKPEVVTPFEPELVKKSQFLKLSTIKKGRFFFQYLGDWYSVWETPMPFTTRENTCNRYQYGPLTQGVNNMSVYITSTYPGSGLGEAPCAWMQPATPMNPTGDTLLYMSEVGAPSWIIDTDYETFAATFSCEEGPLGHYKNADIFTRDPSAPQEAVSNI